MCVAGCTSNGGKAPEAEPTNEVVQTIDPAKAATLTLGEDLKIVAKLPRKMGDQDVYFRSFTADGKVLGSASLPEKPSGEMGHVTSQSHPVMYDPTTGQFAVLDDRDRKEPTQMGAVVSTGDFVVWLETPESHIGVSRITIYSYDRRTKAVTELARTGESDDLVYGADLAVAGDMAYFSMPAWLAKDSAKSAVYAVPVDGSTPAKVLLKGGASVRIADGAMTYAVGDQRLSRDLETGETKPAPVSPRATDPGFCGAEFTESFETLCVGEREEVDLPEGEEEDPRDAGLIRNAILTIEESSGRTTVFKPFPSNSSNLRVPHDVVKVGPWIGVTMTDDESGDADRKFLVDLDSRTVVAFPKGTSFGALNEDRTQVLLSTPGSGKPQLIVRIPVKD